MNIFRRLLKPLAWLVPVVIIFHASSAGAEDIWEAHEQTAQKLFNAESDSDWKQVLKEFEDNCRQFDETYACPPWSALALHFVAKDRENLSPRAENERWQRAEELYEKAVKAAPGSVRDWVGLSETRVAQFELGPGSDKDFRRLIQSLEKAAASVDQPVYFYLKIADLFSDRAAGAVTAKARQGLFNEADKWYEKAAKGKKQAGHLLYLRRVWNLERAAQLAEDSAERRAWLDRAAKLLDRAASSVAKPPKKESKAVRAARQYAAMYRQARLKQESLGLALADNDSERRDSLARLQERLRDIIIYDNDMFLDDPLQQWQSVLMARDLLAESQAARLTIWRQARDEAESFKYTALSDSVVNDNMDLIFRRLSLLEPEGGWCSGPWITIRGINSFGGN